MKLPGNVKDPKSSQVLYGFSDVYFGLKPRKTIFDFRSFYKIFFML